MQTVFPLKGKPLNARDLKRDIVYKNDELYNLTLRRKENLEEVVELYLESYALLRTRRPESIL